MPDMTESRLRVAYVLTPITFGGAEKVSLNFLSSVDRESFDVRPILLIRPWEEDLYFGSELRRLGYTYETVPVALHRDGDPLRILRVMLRLYSYLKKGAYNVIHTHGYFADICGQIPALMLGIGSVSTCHGFIDTDFKLRLYNRLDKYALRLCKIVIAVSEIIKDDLIRSGLLESRITVIPNAVSPACSEDEFEKRRREKRLLLKISPDEWVVGCLGRLSTEKGQAYLVEGVQGMLEAGLKIKLVIVGDGPERVALEQQVAAGGYGEQVVFTGFQTDPENWYPVFDVFALPSLTEGTPLALLESMAAGLPVVASAVGGVPKIVTDGVNGLLVAPGLPLSIKEKLMLLHADTELCRRLGETGRETVQAAFSIGGWCRRIENCYREISKLSIQASTVGKAISPP